jgi:hypothetical protein
MQSESNGEELDASIISHSVSVDVPENDASRTHFILMKR